MTNYAHKDNNTITLTLEVTDLTMDLYRDVETNDIMARMNVTVSISGGYRKRLSMEGRVEDFMDAGQFTTWKQLMALVKNGLLAQKFDTV
jgi:hypothetical protein